MTQEVNYDILRKLYTSLISIGRTDYTCNRKSKSIIIVVNPTFEIK